MWSTKPCHEVTGSAAATSLCCLTFEIPLNSEAETEISYMVPQPPCVLIYCCLFGQEKKSEKEREEKNAGSVGKEKKAKLEKTSSRFSLQNLKEQLTLVSLTETSLDPGRALLSKASSSASEGCCCGGGEESSEAEEEVEVEKNDDDDLIDVDAAPLLLLQAAALSRSAARAAATREFMSAFRRVN